MHVFRRSTSLLQAAADLYCFPDLEVFIVPPLQVWDMRSLKPGGSSVDQASRQLRDVDWAAATPHVVSTVEDNQRLRVWDLRCRNRAFCPGCRQLLGRPGLILLTVPLQLVMGACTCRQGTAGCCLCLAWYGIVQTPRLSSATLIPCAGGRTRGPP